MEDNFTPDSAMALAGFSLLPIFIWFALRSMTLKLFLFGSLLLLVFSRGTLEILGVSSVLMRVAAEGLVLACFMLTVVMSQSPKRRLPGFSFFLAFCVTAFISIVFNNINGVMLLFFFRDYLFAIIFFYATINASMSAHEVRVIFRLGAFLLISQIFANFIKVIVLSDIVEPYIGTMANLGGSLTVMFTLVGAVLSISLYLVLRKKTYLVLLIGFIAFSIIGEKRAVLVYIPIIYLLLLIVHQRQRGTRVGHLFKQIVLFSCISLVLIYTSLRLMPSLNPERKVWGSFDIDYALDYGSRYVTTGAGAIEQTGRAQAPIYLLSRAASDSSIHVLFGYGAGHLIKSKFNALAERSGGQTDLTMDLYGVGYGARTAFLQLFLQVGLVGAALYFALWFRIFRGAYAACKQHGSFQTKSIGTLVAFGISVVFLIDFFTYSVVSVQLGVISVITAIIMSLFYQNK